MMMKYIIDPIKVQDEFMYILYKSGEFKHPIAILDKIELQYLLDTITDAMKEEEE